MRFLNGNDCGGDALRWRGVPAPDGPARGAEAHQLIVVRGGDDALLGAALRADDVTDQQLSR